MKEQLDSEIDRLTEDNKKLEEKRDRLQRELSGAPLSKSVVTRQDYEAYKRQQAAEETAAEAARVNAFGEALVALQDEFGYVLVATPISRQDGGIVVVTAEVRLVKK